MKDYRNFNPIKSIFLRILISHSIFSFTYPEAAVFKYYRLHNFNIKEFLLPLRHEY